VKYWIICWKPSLNYQQKPVISRKTADSITYDTANGNYKIAVFKLQEYEDKEMIERKKIIIDTDIGDDIDDAFAIALALKAPELEILGITTVFQNAGMRAKQAKALLTSYKAEKVPVYKGLGKPLSRKGQDQDWEEDIINCQYYPELEKYEYEEEEAVEFIIRMLRQYPGEITLVPIGPLTNIASAIKKAPDIIPLIKDIRLMGGVFFRNFAEWNILCDAVAAKIVFTSGAPVYAVGLDVTEECLMPEENIRSYLNKNKPESEVLQKFLAKWVDYNKKTRPILHDPLTVETLINPDTVTFQQINVKVLTEDGHTGETRIVPEAEDGSSAIKIAVEVKSKEFVDFFASTVLV
jgi:purine nucleosidase